MLFHSSPRVDYTVAYIFVKVGVSGKAGHRAGEIIGAGWSDTSQDV